MLEVYGITYDHTNNYGSCFQAYALQQAIEQISIDGEPCSYKLIPIRQMKGYPKPSAAHIVGRLLMHTMHLHFHEFEQKIKWVPLGSFEELYAHGGRDADAYVCGSDVIWNPDHNMNVSAYYLDFAKKYSFSYAASFGKTSFDRCKLDEIAGYISQLDQISVREESGKKIAEEITGKPVKVVCDPVILLTREKWDSIIQHVEENEKYIFVYTTHMNSTLDSFVRKLSEQTHLKVVRTAWAVSSKTLIKQGIKSIQSPEQWLRLLSNAEYVVTNSFHATAFSVIFHRKFFTVVHGGKGEGINVRMNDFLNQVGLEDRIFSDIPDRLDLGEIDYTAVDGKVGALREESLAFLRENLEAAYRAKMSHSQKE